MELIAKDLDLHVYLGSFAGSQIRFFVDPEGPDYYLNLEDLRLIVEATVPDGMKPADFVRIKLDIINQYFK